MLQRRQRQAEHRDHRQRAAPSPQRASHWQLRFSSRFPGCAGHPQCDTGTSQPQRTIEAFSPPNPRPRPLSHSASRQVLDLQWTEFTVFEVVLASHHHFAPKRARRNPFHQVSLNGGHESEGPVMLYITSPPCFSLARVGPLQVTWEVCTDLPSRSCGGAFVYSAAR